MRLRNCGGEVSYCKDSNLCFLPSRSWKVFYWKTLLHSHICPTTRESCCLKAPSTSAAPLRWISIFRISGWRSQKTLHTTVSWVVDLRFSWIYGDLLNHLGDMFRRRTGHGSFFLISFTSEVLGMTVFWPSTCRKITYLVWPSMMPSLISSSKNLTSTGGWRITQSLVTLP